MKAILVIDTPKKCGDCKLFMNNGNSYWCVITGFDTTRSSMPNNCPLKPIPHKREAIGILNDYARGKILGFNSCLKIILGETE